MIYVLVGAIVLLGISLFVNYNMYKKYSTLEDIALENQKYSEETTDLLNQFKTRVMSQRSYLKQLDRKGAFESDDEVGYFFKELKQIVEDISVFFGEEEEIDEVEENEQKIVPFITSRF